MCFSLVGEGQSNCTTRLVSTIVALTAVVAVALGVLAILANHGYHLGSLEGIGRIGTIAGGSLVGLGVLIPIAVLGVRSCQNSSAPASELKPEVPIDIVTEPDSKISKKANVLDIPTQPEAKQVDAVVVWWVNRNIFGRFKASH